MSRDRNNLQRHIEECLVDRREMRDWIVRAQARSPWIHVTERDWELYGDIPIDRWLLDKGLDEPDPRDDWDWGDETYDAPEIHEWSWRLDTTEDVYEYDGVEYWESPDMEFGGQFYPAEHVLDARDQNRDPKGVAILPNSA